MSPERIGTNIGLWLVGCFAGFLAGSIAVESGAYWYSLLIVGMMFLASRPWQAEPQRGDQ